MYQSLYTAEIEGFEDEFKEVSSEWRFVLANDGEVISLNDEAARWFQRGKSFFLHLDEEECKKAIILLKSIFLQGKIFEFNLTHQFDSHIFTVSYNGKYKNGKFFLLGSLRHNPKPDTLYGMWDQEVLPHFIHPYVILDHDLMISKHNNEFASFLGIDSVEKRLSAYKEDENHRAFYITSFAEEVFLEKKPLVKDYNNESKGDYFRLKGIYLPERYSVLIFIYDQSFEKRYNHLLLFQNQMESVSHLSAGVAHELRNPLSVIKGFLQLSSLTNSYDKYSSTILSEVDRMNGIIENFLSMARRNIKKEVQNPAKLLHSIADIIHSECLMKGINFTFDIYQGTEEIKVNDSSLKQVALNALRNAMEAFTQKNKNNCFSLKSFVEKGEYWIVIKDNGDGIPKDILKKLEAGKPFFTTKDQGTGIGIPLCKTIMQDHNGTFTIKSDPDSGTSIVLTFPLVKNY
ncbi:nitrogen regulation protein NR(II) [Thalassorhabdus alkalitolerans]|uniref:histidine kinase n=2 Tax=Bacillaceae TaxID=186817 RepID=A0ABW0YPV2_9BACI